MNSPKKCEIIWDIDILIYTRTIPSNCSVTTVWRMTGCTHRGTPLSGTICVNPLTGEDSLIGPEWRAIHLGESYSLRRKHLVSDGRMLH